MNDYNKITKVTDKDKLKMLKESFDADYQKRMAELNDREYLDSVSKKDFGYIKESFENLSPELFKTKSGRNIMGKYLSCIKETNTLKSMHSLYECIRKADPSLDVDTYLKEALSMFNTVNAKQLKEDTEKLGKILAEACEALGVETSEELISENKNEVLNEALNYLGTHKKTHKNLPEYTKFCNAIKEHIMGGEIEVEKTFNLDEALKSYKEKFGELDEDTKQLVNELTNSSDKKTLFERYKSNCVEKVNEKKNLFEAQGDAFTSERLSVVLEKLNKRKYNPDTVSEDVLNFVEMEKSLN